MAKPGNPASLEDVRLNFQDNQDSTKPPPLASRVSLTENKHKGQTLLCTVGQWPIWSNRDWMGVLKILLFYVLYYTIIIAGIMVAALYFGVGSQPEDKPKLQGRLHSPGMHIFPAMMTTANLKDENAPSIYDDGHKPTSEKGHTITINKDGDDKFYGPKMKEWVSIYNETADAVQCDQTNPADHKDNLGKVCKWYSDYDWIEEQCGADFGYNSGSPCFAVSLNKITNWKLQGLSASATIDVAYDADGNPDDTKKIVGNGNSVHFHCNQFEFDSDDNLDLSKEGSQFKVDFLTHTLGDDSSTLGKGQLPDYYYPYAGHSKQNGWDKVPDPEIQHSNGDKAFVIMKITKNNLDTKGKANFKCHAYADNIQNSYLVKGTDLMSFEWRTHPKMSSDNNYITYMGMFALGEFSISYNVPT